MVLPPLSQVERMRRVLQMLETRDSVHVAELAQTFSVSAVTVRNDLSQLARQGLVARVRGGVRPLQRGESELVIVTNGIVVAASLADVPGVSVLVTGGMLRLSAMSLVGDLGADLLRTTRITKGFLGAGGVSLDRGLMDLNPDEVRIKQEMAAACEQVIGIVDGTKWHRSALLSFAPSDGVHAIVTDESAPAEQVEAWRARGTQVTVAKVVHGERSSVRRVDLRRTPPTNGGER